MPHLRAGKLLLLRSTSWLLGKAIVCHLVLAFGESYREPPRDPSRLPGWPGSGRCSSPFLPELSRVWDKCVKESYFNQFQFPFWMMSRPLLRTLSITHLRSIFVFFLFPWTRTLISLSPTAFTAVSVNHCRSSVLNVNRIWGSVSKFSKNQATCLQTWRLHTLVQCRKPAARWPLPTWDGSCSCPSQGASVLLLCGCA